MKNCTFKIDPRLRAAFDARPSRRTVHALVQGEVVSYTAAKDQHGERVSCNPFKFTSFVRASDEQKVTSAAIVVLHADKTIEAVDLQ